MRSHLVGYDYRLVLSLNYDNVCEVPITEYLPKLDSFDISAVDIYSMPDITSEIMWSNWYDSWQSNAPLGFGAWVSYARSIGKPISFPEWGVHPLTLHDNPFWISKLYAAFCSIASQDPYRPGAGMLAGEAYYNNGSNTQIYPTANSAVPLAAAAYTTYFART